MTTDLITFFHPDGSTGEDWTFSSQLEDAAAAEVWVFDRSGKADFSRFAAMKFPSKRELEGEVLTQIQQSGGIYFCAYNHNGVIRGDMVKIECQGYAPPKRMLRLSPAAGTRFEDIAGRMDFAPGDHLVVPVSATAEKRLQDFCDDLDGFPADLQSLILNVIRRPSLEWRIHRLERTLSGLPVASQAAQQKERGQRGDFLDKLYDAVMWKIPIGPAIAALLVLFISVVAYYEYFAQGGGQAAAAEKINEDTEPEVSESLAGGEDTPAEGTPQEDTDSQSLEESLKGLYTALQASKNADLKNLYEKHFSGQTNATTAGWGMAKLQALQLGVIKPNDTILSRSDNPTAVNTLYEQKALSAVREDDDSLSLLAWSCCKYFGKAELKGTATKEALPLENDLNCGNLNKTDALSGLETLTDWVEQQPEDS